MSLHTVRSFACRLNASSSNVLTYTVKRCLKLQSVHYAKPGVKPKKGAEMVPGGASKKKMLEVEEDPYILCSRLVGGNIKNEGEDPILKPDDEYPEWLWELKLTREPVPLEELDEDDPRYWRTLKRMTLQHNFRLKKVKKL